MTRGRAGVATRRGAPSVQNDAPGYGAFLFLTSLYVFIVIVRPHEWPVIALNVPILATIALMGRAAWLVSRPQFDAIQYFALVALAICIFLSLLDVSGQFAVAKLQNFTMVVVFVFFFVANATRTLEGQKRIIKTVILATTIICLHSIQQMWDVDKIGFSGQEATFRRDVVGTPFQATYVGIFGDPNDLGMLLIIAIPLILWLRHSAKQSGVRLFYNLLLAGHFYAIYLTNSRGTIVAVIAAFIAWITVQYNAVKMVLVGAAFGPLFMILAPDRFGLTGDESSQGRIYAWYEGMQLFQREPILGVGMDQFREYHLVVAHNSWVQVLAELGVLGYTFWSMLLYVSLVHVFRFQEAAYSPEPQHAVLEDNKVLFRAMLVSYVGGLAAMFFISRAFQLPIFLFTALIVGQKHMIERELPGFAKSYKPTPYAMVGAFLSILAVYVVVRFNS